MVPLLAAMTAGVEPYERAVLIFACGGAHYYLSRADDVHSWPLFAPVLIAGASAMRKLAPAWTAAAVAASLALMMQIYGISPQLVWVRNTIHLTRTARGSEIASVDDAAKFAASWGAIYLDVDEASAVRFVRSRTAPDEPVFLGLLDHSRTFANCLRTAWLLGRPAPMWHFVFEPRITTREETQRRMIQDLERASVRWMILTDWADVGDPGHFARKERGSTSLDGFIRERYALAAKFGRYEVWGSRP